MNDQQNPNRDGRDQDVPDFLEDTPLPWENGGSPQLAASRPGTATPVIRTSLTPPPAPRLPSSGNERTGTGSAHPMTRISEEARAMMEDARQKRTVTDRLTRKGRELIQHEEKLMRVLYRGREKGLEYVVEAECQALREVCNAWLAINGTRLETDTRVFIIAERERLEEVLAAYASRYYAEDRAGLRRDGPARPPPGASGPGLRAHPGQHARLPELLRPGQRPLPGDPQHEGLKPRGAYWRPAKRGSMGKDSAGPTSSCEKSGCVGLIR